MYELRGIYSIPFFSILQYHPSAFVQKLVDLPQMLPSFYRAALSRVLRSSAVETSVHTVEAANCFRLYARGYEVIELTSAEELDEIVDNPAWIHCLL
jgi:hypothetical protein